MDTYPEYHLYYQMLCWFAQVKHFQEESDLKYIEQFSFIKKWNPNLLPSRRILQEFSLDCKEIKPVNPKGNQSWIFIGRTDAKAEVPILWPPDAKNWLIGKDPDAGKDWRQEEKGTTEDEMVGWHHRLDRHEFDQAPGVGDGQGNLACCSPWSCKQLDTTEQLNWTEKAMFETGKEKCGQI